ncbi:MAG: DHA2 family efflux MFS transporter permease subunit [Bacillota bacterium]|nr:DHA2 family efflux MFS transporter permease subunit [Bacillota bacterium]
MESSTVTTKTNEKIGFQMLVIILGVFMAVLDTSIVNVAIPKMMTIFGVNESSIQWVVTAYTLTVGSIIPVTGYLGERFGYKRVFMVALTIFTIGSGLCGAAWSNSSMILFRIIQAIGGGALMPISMAMVTRMIPKEKRGMAIGVFGIAIMFAPAVGPTLSGYITEYLDWRLIFYINVPIGIADVFLAYFFLKNSEVNLTKKFDLLGFILSVVGFSTLLYGFGEVPDHGWNSTDVIPFLVIAIISLTLFIFRELNIDEPMLDLRLLKNTGFSFGLLLIAVTSIMLLGVLFLLPIFLQNIMGFSAMRTGIILLPQALVAGALMPVAGILFDKVGIKPLAGTGFLIMAIAMFFMIHISEQTAMSTIILLLMLRSAGIGITMMPLQANGLNQIPDNMEAQGTAILNAVNQIANSFGVAWLSLLLSQRSKIHFSADASHLSIFSQPVTQFMQKIQAYGHLKGMSVTQAKSLAIRFFQGQVQLHSIVQAIDDIFYVLTFVAIGAALITFLQRDKKREAS